ncbi:unnamed protein product [Soboliphyme baturini]|uniref:Beta'-coat protein n=1 Tax=Soboliphyme baturini TaxID=241478 RepID=A0A183ING9_9BILA|nr:unnamed protein product [Soboliphyme baturini]
MLCSLYNGNVHIWNYDTQQLLKSFEVCDLPVRVAKFVPRKNCTCRLCPVVGHPPHSAVYDMTIKLWDWDSKWQCKQTFEGHSHYVMQLVINPKDTNTFATACLDRSIKVWQLGSSQAKFTLEGHEKGVNCVDFYHGGDKPYLISGADDHLVKIWDYQNKTCVATLEGHAQNVSSVCFHPNLPVILSGSEDSTVRVWHANTYRLETSLNYGLDRVWTISTLKGSNAVAIGYDEGSILIKLGREEPAISMDSSGKIIWAKHLEVQQANLKSLGAGIEVKDGERLPLTVKDLGACDIYPQFIQHNSNGRFVVIYGDGEYVIYTAMALRNKAFGSGLEFVWSADSNTYAVRESMSSVKIFCNFKDSLTLKLPAAAEGIFGGTLLGVRSAAYLSFYDWDKGMLVRRIEIAPKQVFWSDKELVAITTEDSFFILRYYADIVVSDDGIEDAFEVISEYSDVVKTATWIRECFVYTTVQNRLNYCIGSEIVTVSHLDRPMYILGYISAENRLYLSDKDLNIVSYLLLQSVLNYQTAVLRNDFDTADSLLNSIPDSQRTRIAQFLEKQGYKKQALSVSQDPEHRFELALSVGDLKLAYSLAAESDSEEKWRQLSKVATTKNDFALAGECMSRARDYGALLMLATSCGSKALTEKVASDALTAKQYNIAFLANVLLGRSCIFRSYLLVAGWKESLSEINPKLAKSLADPTQYENLFPNLEEDKKVEARLNELRDHFLPASAYANMPVSLVIPSCSGNVFSGLHDFSVSFVMCNDRASNIIPIPYRPSTVA